MVRQKDSKVSQLIKKGVRIACPDCVEIGDEVATTMGRITQAWSCDATTYVGPSSRKS